MTTGDTVWKVYEIPEPNVRRPDLRSGSSTMRRRVSKSDLREVDNVYEGHTVHK